MQAQMILWVGVLAANPLSFSQPSYFYPLDSGIALAAGIALNFLVGQREPGMHDKKDTYSL